MNISLSITMSPNTPTADIADAMLKVAERAAQTFYYEGDLEVDDSRDIDVNDLGWIDAASVFRTE